MNLWSGSLPGEIFFVEGMGKCLSSGGTSAIPPVGKTLLAHNKTFEISNQKYCVYSNKFT